jgi:transposase
MVGMKKKRASDYSDKEKLDVLRDLDKYGNLSKVSTKYGLSRQTIYNWKDSAKQLQEQVIELDKVTKKKRHDLLDKEVLKNIGTYKNLLSTIGDLEKRKENLSAKVELLLMNVVDAIEKHEDLKEIHPKDLSKMMKDLHDVRKELSNEPTIIIEYKNKMREQTLQVLQDFLNIEQLKEFAQKMEAIEAEYELL